MHGILSVLFRVVQLAFAGASSVLVPAYEAISFLSRTAPASYILWEGASEVPGRKDQTYHLLIQLPGYKNSSDKYHKCRKHIQDTKQSKSAKLVSRDFKISDAST